MLLVLCIHIFVLCFSVYISWIDIFDVDTFSKFAYALEKILMTLVEFDSGMYFLNLSNDTRNGTQNDSEGLKIVQKLKNYRVPLKPAAVKYLLRSH